MDDAPDRAARGASPAPARPAPVRQAGLLVVVEGVALALLGIGYAVRGLLGDPEDRLATVLAGVFAVVAGAGLVAVGRALGRTRSWALAPTVVCQVFLVVVAVGLLQGGVVQIGLPLLLLGGTVVYLIATPVSRQAFSPDG